MTHLAFSTAILIAFASMAGAAVASDSGKPALTAFGAEIGPGFDAAEEMRRRGKGRSKPRIPGGSGCDDPGDVLEHPECAG